MLQVAKECYIVYKLFGRPRLFFVVFQEILITTMFIGSQNFISLLSFIFVSAVVNEIC